MRLAVTLLIVVAIGYVLSFWLSVSANPEIHLWRHVVDTRRTEIAAIRRQEPDTSIIFFTGGSSTAFSIDPRIIEEACGTPAYNLAQPVAAGAEYLLYQAFEETRPGDVLVVCLEPFLLTSEQVEPSPTRFSFAMAASEGNPSVAGGGNLGRGLTTLDYLRLPRPGASHITVLLAKTATQEGYRYKPSDIRYRGRLETSIKGAKPTDAIPAHKMTAYGRDLLLKAKHEAAERQVTLYFSMPWHFCTESKLRQSRERVETLLEEIDPIIPVISDHYFGRASEGDWFSDSPQHLTASGSTERTQSMASTLHGMLLSRGSGPAGRR